MSTLKVSIGEYVLKMKFHTANAALFFHGIFPELQECRNDHIDLYIEIDAGFGSKFTSYHINRHTDSEGRIRFLRTDYMLTIDSKYLHASIHVYDELALKHAFMHLFSLYIVKRNWGLLIHSSCVLENGRAHLFAGHSGAGKSTVAAMSRPRGMFSDEATLVKITSEAVTVFHSPFRSEMQTSRKEQLAPSLLGSIQILQQASCNQRIPMNKKDGMLALMETVFYWYPSPEATNTIMRKLKELVENVSVYKLHFRNEPAFWELIS